MCMRSKNLSSGFFQLYSGGWLDNFNTSIVSDPMEFLLIVFFLSTHSFLGFIENNPLFKRWIVDSILYFSNSCWAMFFWLQTYFFSLLQLDLFTTLKTLGFLGTFLLFVGHRTLSYLASTSAKVKSAWEGCWRHQIGLKFQFCRLLLSYRSLKNFCTA